MPEAPELQVVTEFLGERLPGRAIRSANVMKPMVRSLAGDMAEDAKGRRFESVERRGKFLLLGLSGGRMVVINPKLTGALQYCTTNTRLQKRTCVRFQLDGDIDLRYTDAKQMGQFYYVGQDQVKQVPGLSQQGPDVLDQIGFDEFKSRLRRFHGEIKGVLTRGRVISGIGNAYADEILFAARVSPFRRRKELTDDELRRIHASSFQVVLDAIDDVRARMGDRIDRKVRDLLKIHNRGGQQCPSCGNKITELRANRRITSYCRHCQPGDLFTN